MGSADAHLLEQLVERTPNGILVTDADGRLTIVNAAARSMLPMVPNPLGRPAAEALPISEVAEALKLNDRETHERTFSYVSKELLLKSVPLDPFGRLLIIEDISQLRKAEQYRREFVANVSHELRTPATSIAGFAEMLLDDKEKFDDDSAQMISVIHRNALRLNNLFDDLLTLAKIDAQSGPLAKERLALSPIVAEAVDKQRSRAVKRRVQFQLLVSEQLDVWSNRDALNHIVGNLVENAVKYNRDGGLVTVRAEFRQDKDKILLEVIDLGMGIAPSHQDRIFERFFRVDKARNSSVKGTGLGLSIVKRLVDQLNSTIELRSRVGSGSIFRLWLDPCDSMNDLD